MDGADLKAGGAAAHGGHGTASAACRGLTERNDTPLTLGVRLGVKRLNIAIAYA